MLQPAQGYRAGTDAVLLAASLAPPTTGSVRILDVGSGVGVVGLCVAARLHGSSITLLEKQPELVDLARQNIQRNNLSKRAVAVEYDVFQSEGRGNLSSEFFDCVVSNPPYYDSQCTRPSDNALKAAAHTMGRGGLDGWLDFMVSKLRRGGRLLLIHRADNLANVLNATKGRLGALIVKPIHPRLGTPAHRIIVQGTKGSGKPLLLAPPLILHNSGLGYRRDVERVLRFGAALDLTTAGTQ
ncbi:MAG: tRNA1(Val) (adenine(37)-N6)-methyltransferase [Hyphomicrobiaceae bacterium]